jgi:hypothetical protein
MNREKVSKRILGLFSFLLGMAMAFASGFDFYTVETTVIGIVLAYSATLLGIDTYKQVNGKA